MDREAIHGNAFIISQQDPALKFRTQTHVQENKAKVDHVEEAGLPWQGVG